MITPEFRKKMADSWFSYLQSQICKEFEYLENNKVKFSKRDWNKNKKKKVEELHFCYQMGKYLIKLELINLPFQEFFLNNLDQKY